MPVHLVFNHAHAIADRCQSSLEKAKICTHKGGGTFCQRKRTQWRARQLHQQLHQQPPQQQQQARRTKTDVIHSQEGATYTDCYRQQQEQRQQQR